MSGSSETAIAANRSGVILELRRIETETGSLRGRTRKR
jgi:hypothetical protein